MKDDCILLTGASGFLGRTIYKQLSHDHLVLTLGRSSCNNYNIDLTTDIPIFKHSFRTVIHAAGKAHVNPKTEEEIKEVFQTNFEGTIRLLNGLTKSSSSLEEFILISTVAVYGQTEGSMIDEKHPLSGNTPYAKSKILAEKYVEEWCNENLIKLTILRLPLLVGPSPPGNLGAMIRIMRSGFYIGCASNIAKKSMLLAEDVAKSILAIAKIGGIYNLTDGYHPSIFELENAVARMLKKNSLRRLPDPYLCFLAKMGDFMGNNAPFNSLKLKILTSSLTFSDAKARRHVGWKSQSVIENFPIF